MRRYAIVGLAVVALAAYLSFGLSTIRRTISGWYNMVTIQIGGQISPLRRLEHTRLIVEEYQVQLDEATSTLAAEIASSEEFQDELERIYASMSKRELPPEQQGLYDRIKYFRWFRDQGRRLKELDDKILQAIILAKLNGLTEAQDSLNKLMGELEKTVKEEAELLELMKQDRDVTEPSQAPRVTPSPIRKPSTTRPTAVPGVQ